MFTEVSDVIDGNKARDVVSPECEVSCNRLVVGERFVHHMCVSAMDACTYSGMQQYAGKYMVS